MRKYGILIGLLMLVFASGPVRANEGVFKVMPEPGRSGSCYFSSVFLSGSYNILGTCRGLVLPVTPELTRYFLWAVDEEGGVARVGEIVRGKLFERAGDKFIELMVTAEEVGGPRKPSETVIARGKLEAIPLVGEEVNVSFGEDKEVGVTPVVERQAEPLLPDGAVDSEKGGVGKVFVVLGRVVGVLLLGFLGIGAIVAIVSRRRNIA